MNYSGVTMTYYAYSTGTHPSTSLLHFTPRKMRDTHQYPKENKPIVLITPLSHSQPITPSKRPRGRPRKDGLPSGSDSLKKIKLDDSVSAPITAKSRSTARVSTRSRKTSVDVAPKRPRRRSEPVKRPKKTPSNPYSSVRPLQSRKSS